MDLYEAINQMREMTKENKPFSFSFMSCNTTAQESEGVIEVMHARLLRRQSKDYHRDAEMVEKYLDLDTMQARQFYQPLLMTFNGEKVTLQ